MKVIVPHFTTLFDFYSAKYSFANYSFVVILLRILQFPQNTENVRSDLNYFDQESKGLIIIKVYKGNLKYFYFIFFSGSYCTPQKCSLQR